LPIVSSSRLERRRREAQADVSERREATRQQEHPSQGGQRKEAGSAGRREVSEDGLSVICCCVGQDEEARPAEACTFCGGSGWALPCPGCAGMGIVIDNSDRAPHLCETCAGRRVQPMLQLVERKEAS
jgi:hypothetical protein